MVIQGSDDIASRAIDLLKEIYTNLGPKLQVNQVNCYVLMQAKRAVKHKQALELNLLVLVWCDLKTK